MKIITLTGASASGKDLLLKEVVKDNGNIKPIVSVTTRPKREGEEDGVDYKFISFEEFKELFENDELIERREYHTIDGIWHYGIAKDSIDLESTDAYIVILDVYGVIQLTKYLSELETDTPIEVYPIFINCNGQQRLLRSLHRESNLKDTQVAEICRRYLDDQEQVVMHKDLFDIILKNENQQDLERCKSIIKGLVDNTETIKEELE